MREHVDAFDHAARRQATALLRACDSGADPRRRPWRAALAGAVLTGLFVIANAVTGVGAGHRMPALPRDGVVIDRATGGSYVTVDGLLHPALNLASAELIAGPRTTTVDPALLRQVRHGPPVGIPGAPDSLPAAARLDRGPWSACSATGRPQIDIAVGSPAPPTGTDAVAIRDATHPASTWLVERGTRFAVTPAARTLLGLETSLPVPGALLSLLPAGPALDVPRIPHAGRRVGLAVPGAVRVGDLVRVADTGRVYVVVDGGLAALDPVARDLVAGAAIATHLLTARQLTGVASVPRPASIPDAWPRTLARPTATTAAGTVCIGWTPAVGRRASAGRWAMSTLPGPVGHHGPGVVTTRADGGQLVRVTTGRGSRGYALVAESLRFAIPTATAARRLGYDPARAVPVPAPLFALVPPGPGLDPAAAARVYRGPAPR